MDINLVKISGKITSLHNIYKTKNNNKFQKLILRTTLEYKGEEYSSNIDCIIWNKNINKFKSIDIDKKVLITGRLRKRYLGDFYTSNIEKTEIVVNILVNIN